MYVEKHHIFPKSLGGSNDWTNIVKLSPKEHFICHYLLTKMLMANTDQRNRMYSAFMMMKGTSNSHNYSRYYNSRLYDSVRKKYSISQSKRMTGSNNGNYGRMWIVNYLLKENKNISPKELSYYEDRGWKKGRCYEFNLYDGYGNRITKTVSCKKKIQKTNRTNKRKEHKLLFSNGIYVPLSNHKIIKYTRKILNIPDSELIKFDDVDIVRNILYNKIYTQNISRNIVYENYGIFYIKYTILDKVVMCIRPDQILLPYKEILKNRKENKKQL